MLYVVLKIILPGGLIDRAKYGAKLYKQRQEEEYKFMAELDRYVTNTAESRDGSLKLEVTPGNENWDQIKRVTASTGLEGYEIRMKTSDTDFVDTNYIDVDNETFVEAMLWDPIYDKQYGEPVTLEVIRVGYAKYTVVNYLENLDGSYAVGEENEIENGKVRTLEEVEPKEYEGFQTPEKESVAITKDGSAKVEFYYTRNTYNLTINKGTGIATVEGAGSYKYEQEITIKATASEGYTFKEWTGEFTSSDKETKIIMPARDIEQTANTTINRYTVTLNKGTGIKSVSGDGTYNYGETVTIKANLISDSYEWVNWTGNSTQTSREYSFKMPSKNISYTANGKSLVFDVTVKAGDNVTEVSVEGGASHMAGTQVTVKATLKKDYVETNWSGQTAAALNNVRYHVKHTYSFNKWTGTGASDSTQITYTFTMPKSAVSLTASAKETTSNVDQQKYQQTGGTVSSYYPSIPAAYVSASYSSGKSDSECLREAKQKASNGSKISPGQTLGTGGWFGNVTFKVEYKTNR